MPSSIIKLTETSPYVVCNVQRQNNNSSFKLPGTTLYVVINNTTKPSSKSPDMRKVVIE